MLFIINICYERTVFYFTLMFGPVASPFLRLGFVFWVDGTASAAVNVSMEGRIYTCLVETKVFGAAYTRDSFNRINAWVILEISRAAGSWRSAVKGIAVTSKPRVHFPNRLKPELSSIKGSSRYTK